MSSLANISFDTIEDSAIETTFCPICKSPDMSLLHTMGPFKVVLCKDCGIIYLNPRLKESEMTKVYQENDYFSGAGDSGYQNYDYTSQEETLRMTFRRFLKKLNKYGIASGKLLELGCGYGYFLDEAKSCFSEMTGTEFSQEAANHARKISGADIYTGDLNALPEDKKDFDVIVTANVLEHIYDPVEFLYSAKKHLVKGGRIVVATPDIGSIWYKIMKSKWQSFKIPEHVVFYSESTLISLFKKIGYQNIMPIPFAHAYPLGLLSSALGIRLPEFMCRKPVWLPWTVTAVVAQKV